MKDNSCNPQESRYEDGMRRLIAISETSRSNAHEGCDGDFERPEVAAKHLCLVCGYMWGVNPERKDGPKKCPACASIRWNADGLKRHTCKQCSHRWMSKLEEPTMCPCCRSKLWNKETEKFICTNCGNAWINRSARGAPGGCPACGSGRISRDTLESMCRKCGYSGNTDPKCVSRCPVCRTKLSIIDRSVKYPKISKEVRPEHKRDRSVSEISPAVMAVLMSEADDTGKIIELTNKCNIESLDAEILVRCRNGEGAVSIAKSTDASLDKVVMIMISISDGSAGEVH